MLKRLTGLMLLVVCLAFAKTYTFSISAPAQLGDSLLKPGEYSLKLDGERVALIDKDHRRIQANLSVETSDTKFAHTSLRLTNADTSVARIQSIQLAGTNKKIVAQ